MTLIRESARAAGRDRLRAAGRAARRPGFEHVGFAYDAATPVLKDIGFHCRPGQVIALLGATGSGKTSLVNLLPRFYDYTEGSLPLDGRELREYSRRYLRQNIGIVEQEPFLFSRSVRENIGYRRRPAGDPGRDRGRRQSRRHPRHDPVLPAPATTPSWARRASRSPAGKSSAWPSRARCSRTRAS